MATTGVIDVESLELPGHPDATGQIFSLDPETLQGNNIIITSNTGNPIVTSKEELLKVIPRLGSIARPCGKCNKLAEKGKRHMECAQCRETNYCSRECQRAHWKEHKPICLQRKSQEQYLRTAEAAALEAGKVFYSPRTSQAWYRSQTDVVSHAAFHVLEMYKGPSTSLHRSHVAWFELTFDQEKPKDVNAISLSDVKAAPLDIVGPILGGPAALDHVKRGIASGMMPCIFLNKDMSAMCMEMHEAPDWKPYESGLKKPDENWKIHCILMANGILEKT